MAINIAYVPEFSAKNERNLHQASLSMVVDGACWGARFPHSRMSNVELFLCNGFNRKPNPRKRRKRAQSLQASKGRSAKHPKPLSNPNIPGAGSFRDSF